MAETSIQFSVPGKGLGAEVPVKLWSPSDTSPDQPLHVLVANDGPEYDTLSGLTDKLHEFIANGYIQPCRVALVEPVYGKRNEWYGASDSYSAVMATRIIPTIHENVATTGPLIGMGASLGALAMAACEFQYPGTFDGLFLQSASFMHPVFGMRKDNPDLRGFEEYDQVVRFVSKLWTVGFRDKIPLAMTSCYIDEKCSFEGNFLSNKAMGELFAQRGHAVSLDIAIGDHDWKPWGDACNPHLINLLRACWGKPSNVYVAA